MRRPVALRGVKLTPEWRSLLAEAVNEVVADHVDPRFVIAHSYTVKLDSHSAKNDGANILVESRPTAREFETVSALFQALSKGFNERFLEVYAPVTWPDPVKKKPMLAEIDAKIRERLHKTFDIPVPEGASA